jgi:hypothetical protein
VIYKYKGNPKYYIPENCPCRHICDCGKDKFLVFELTSDVPINYNCTAKYSALHATDTYAPVCGVIDSLDNEERKGFRLSVG